MSQFNRAEMSSFEAIFVSVASVARRCMQHCNGHRISPIRALQALHGGGLAPLGGYPNATHATTRDARQFATDKLVKLDNPAFVTPPQTVWQYCNTPRSRSARSALNTSIILKGRTATFSPKCYTGSQKVQNVATAPLKTPFYGMSDCGQMGIDPWVLYGGLKTRGTSSRDSFVYTKILN